MASTKKSKTAKLTGNGGGPEGPSGKFWTLRLEPMEFYVVGDNVAMCQMVIKNQALRRLW